MKEILTKIVAVLLIASCIGGSVYVLLCHRDDTAKEYREILTQADAYVQQGYYVEALACMEKAESMQESVEVEEKMAEAYYKTKDYSTFLSIAQNVQDKTGGNEKIYELLGQYYIEQNQIEAAIYVLKDGYAMFPDNAEIAAMYDEVKGGYTQSYMSYSDTGIWYDGMMVAEDKNGVVLLQESTSRLMNQSFDAIYDISTDDTNSRIWKEDTCMLSACVDGVNGYYDSDGNLRISPDEHYGYLGCFHDGLALVEKGEVWGYIDENFDEVRMQYEKAGAYTEGVAAVCQNGKWGLVDTDGNPVTEFVYDDVVMDEYYRCATGGVVFLKQGEHYCMVDTKGGLIADNYEEVRPFYEKDGYAAVRTDGVWCVVDSTGQEYLKGEYEELASSSQGMVAYKKDGLWGYASVTEGIYTNAKFVEAGPVNARGYAAVLQTDTNRPEASGSGGAETGANPGMPEIPEGTGVYTAEDMTQTEDAASPAMQVRPAETDEQPALEPQENHADETASEQVEPYTWEDTTQWTFIRFNRFDKKESIF